MKKNTQARSFKKTLSRLVAAIMGTAICISLLLFYYFVSYYINTVRCDLTRQLDNAQQFTDNLLSGANKKLFFLTENNEVLRLLNNDSMSNLRLYSSLYNLRSFQQENEGLYQSIYYYNAERDVVYVGMKAFPAADFFDQDILQRIKSGEYRNLMPIPRTAYNGLTSVSTSDYYSFVYANHSQDGVKNAIILNLSTEYVHDASMSIYEDKVDMLIVDSDGQVVLSSGVYPFCSSMKSDDPLSLFLNSGSGGDSILTMDGNRYIVSYVQSKVCGWKYIGIIAYSTIRKEIAAVILKTLLMLTAIIVFFTLIGLFLFRKSYRAHLLRVQEIREKYEQKTRNNDVRVQRALYDAIINAEEKDWNRLRQAGIQPDFAKPFRAVIFAAENFKKLPENLSSSDKELFFYGVRNILQELFSKDGVQAILCEHEEYIITLLNGAEELLTEEWIQTQAAQAQQKAQEYSEISFSVVYSSLLNGREQLGTGCEACADNNKYRIFFGKTMLVSVEQLQQLQQKKYQIPAEPLQILTNCMLAGEKEKSESLVGTLVDSVRGYSFSALTLLVMKIATAMQELHQNDPAWYEEEQMNCWFELIRRLPKLGSLNEVEQEIGWLLDIDILSRPVCKRFGEEKRFSRILSRIQRLIEENYPDSCFNPDSMADQLQISPAYCKKIFRANMGTSLSDYITHYRLEKAAILLVETDISVVSVAEQCGFSNINYFYTIFKKNYGVTASTYRQVHQRVQADAPDNPQAFL